MKGRHETAENGTAADDDLFASEQLPVLAGKGSRGMQSPLAELRGGSFLSGCRGEASLHCRSRVQPRPGKSDENRHFVLGITCRPKREKFHF